MSQLSNMNTTLLIMEDDKMAEFEARKPDFKNRGIDVWQETDKNGDKYLRILVLGGQKNGGLSLIAFENKDEPKPEQTPRVQPKLGKDW